MQSLVTKVLVQTFEEKAGKWQTHAKDGKPKAVRFTFSLRIDHATESGYRYLDLIIYAPMNYVGVYARERWCVIPLEDLTDDDDPEIKPGKDYNEGAAEWKCHAYHDSGWRTDGIDGILREYAQKIIGFSGPSFYEVIEVPAEIEAVQK